VFEIHEGRSLERDTKGRIIRVIALDFGKLRAFIAVFALFGVMKDVFHFIFDRL
jgi:hypothetical protein